MTKFESFLEDYHLIIEAINMEQVQEAFKTFEKYGKIPLNRDLLCEAEKIINENGCVYIGIAGIQEYRYMVFSEYDDIDTAVDFFDVIFDTLSISPDALMDILEI